MPVSECKCCDTCWCSSRDAKGNCTAGTCFCPQHKCHRDGSWYSQQGLSLDVRKIDIDCLTIVLPLCKA